jgi:hypothetical protein
LIKEIIFNSRIELIEKYKPKGIGIEIGVLRGDFSKIILQNSSELQLYLLDCWSAQTKEVYYDPSNVDECQHYCNLSYTLANLKDYFNRIKILKEFSDIAVNFFPNDFFDFIYIDANHSYEAVLKDLNIWYPKLKSGGLFSGDDYVPTCGVIRAVNEFTKNNNIDFGITKGHANWYFTKS